MKLKMRKGKITRPPGAKEPIIRLVGNAEAHLIHDEEQVSIPNTRKDWDERIGPVAKSFTVFFKVFKRWLLENARTLPSIIRL